MNNVTYSQRRASVTDATGSRAKIQLGKEAIRCALNGEWEQAAAANRQILDICPSDCEASNRLAKALMELGHYSAARETLEELRMRSPSNVIARKNLARLDQLQSRSGEARSQPAGAGKSPAMFIAESGKSCTTTLCRPAVPPENAPVSAGDVVVLRAQNDGIIVNALDGQYLGTLQRRLGRRLSKLMAGGNQYDAAVVGIEPGGLSVILRETGQSPALRHVVSFPAQVIEPHRPEPAAEPDEFMPAPNDDPDPAPVDAIDPDDAIDPAENAVMDMPDETPVESAGDDDIPMLDTDDDTTSWSPVAPSSDDEEEWD
ncbi:MAG: tetratricopeptide repeat protein [Chloroflexota bacterium]|nr:tetratricopeptide repeat protein [Chloroflexota bacterium]MDE2961624.1 tetratricopeptide repeat protein [Chloroflexota bacterium]